MPARTKAKPAAKPPAKPAPKAAPKRPGLSLLGRSENALPANPDEAHLETFANRNKDRDYWIILDTTEFSSLCPVTGQPDSAKLQIRYIPDELCVETKSLKFYLASWRNTAAFNEEVVNRILDDIIGTCRPRQIRISGQFSPRGGIQLTVEACHP